ncbi:MAG: ribosome silencing factor [Prevotella sp.]|jgi:ribosome-associated protein|nr:ribosome silencing factor [Prevotella sp.]
MKEVKSLVNNIVAACQEKKAKNIVTVDMSELPGTICQYFVICEGNTPTQVSAISDEIVDYVKKKKKDRPISIDGMREARWVGIDYGTVIVHVFIPELREFYNIENLWADAKLESIPDID